MERLESHYQHRRDNPQKPFVAKEYGVWWARVIDLNNTYHSKIHYSLQEALTTAANYSEHVAMQRQEVTA